MYREYRGAGVIPYYICPLSGHLFFLLQQERLFKMERHDVDLVSTFLQTDGHDQRDVDIPLFNKAFWGDFGGRRDEMDTSCYHTAAREFMEEGGKQLLIHSKAYYLYKHDEYLLDWLVNRLTTCQYIHSNHYLIYFLPLFNMISPSLLPRIEFSPFGSLFKRYAWFSENDDISRLHKRIVLRLFRQRLEMLTFFQKQKRKCLATPPQKEKDQTTQPAQQKYLKFSNYPCESVSCPS